LGGQPGVLHRRPEYVDHAGHLGRAHGHAVVVGAVVRLVRGSEVGQRHAGGGVVLAVLHQVVRVRLTPVAAGAGRSGRAAHLAAIDSGAVGLHVTGRAPGIAVDVRDAVAALDLLGEPQLA